MPECWIALGGNVGSVADTLRSALDELRSAPGVSVAAISQFHRTGPVGADAGPEFINAAARLETDLAPLALLDLLQAIENGLGRVRLRHWGPRTLDLDLLLYGSQVIETPRLVVPHRHLWYRRFVLDPLSEVASEIVHPLKRMTIRELRERLLPRPLICALAGGTDLVRSHLRNTLQPVLPNAELHEWEPENGTLRTTSEPALLFWLGSPLPQSTLASESDSMFQDLPLLPRLDISNSQSPFEDVIRDALRAALGD